VSPFLICNILSGESVPVPIPTFPEASTVKTSVPVARPAVFTVNFPFEQDKRPTVTQPGFEAFECENNLIAPP